MRQRVALARTLAVDPSVLLLDEPFSAVDAQTRIVLQQDLARTLAQARKTALLITHDLLEAVILSDRILVMSARPGQIIDEIADRHGAIATIRLARRRDGRVAGLRVAADGSSPHRRGRPQIPRPARETAS